jgi:hypothetical protein
MGTPVQTMVKLLAENNKGLRCPLMGGFISQIHAQVRCTKVVAIIAARLEYHGLKSALKWK